MSGGSIGHSDGRRDGGNEGRREGKEKRDEGKGRGRGRGERLMRSWGRGRSGVRSRAFLMTRCVAYHICG